MAAIKSHNPTNAEINRHFVIRYEVATEKGTKKIRQFICFLGFHEKHIFIKKGYVSWIPMVAKITKCKHCNKLL